MVPLSPSQLTKLVGLESQVPRRAIWVASPNRVERAYKSKCRFAMALFWNRVHRLQRELLFVPKPAGRKRQMQILLHMTTLLSAHLSMICLRFLFKNEYMHIVFAQLSQLSLSLSFTLSLYLSVSALSLPCHTMRRVCISRKGICVFFANCVRIAVESRQIASPRLKVWWRSRRAAKEGGRLLDLN